MCDGGASKYAKYPTIQEMGATEMSLELWKYYQESYAPLIKKYISMETPEKAALEKKKIAGEIGAEFMKGVDPSKVSANPVKNLRNLLTLGTKETTAQVQGQALAKGRELGELENIVRIGRGQVTSAQSSMEAQAQQAVQKQIELAQMKTEEEIAKSKSISGFIMPFGS